MPSPDSLQGLIAAHPLFTRSRLTSLYSDFRPLTRTNPDGYSANISAWLSLLTDAASHGFLPSSSSSTSPDTLALTVNASLISSLARDDVGRPLAIGAVISDSIKSKHLIPLSTFLQQPSSIYTTPNALLSLGSWVLSKLPLIGTLATPTSAPSTPSISEETINRLTTQYVLLPNLETCARSILTQFQAQHSGVVSQLWTYDSFLASFPNPCTNTTLSQTDASILLTYLSRDLPSLTLSPDRKVIKFAPPTSTSTPEAITQTDITIATLKTTIFQTNAFLNNLNAHSESLSKRIKAYLAKNNKPLALAALKTKKLVDGNISTRAANLNNLEALLFQIEEAADNISLIALLDSGAGALKQLTAQTGGVEKVEEVLERVREAGEDADEISRAVASGLEWVGEGVDEEEVEGELEGMMREQEEKERKVALLEYDRRVREAEEKARREAEELARRLERLEFEVGRGEGREEKERGQEKEKEVVS
ncbi:Snf7-domain-containing protein [Tirmania nivea]|nr:Snf7-domain-containing protein [Tirmania nivea]